MDETSCSLFLPFSQLYHYYNSIAGLRVLVRQTPSLAKSTQRPGSSPTSAAPIGTIVKTTIERGYAYMVPRLYNVEISVEEVVRGKKAEERARKLVDPGNEPKKGFEYLLARVKFGYFERGRTSAGVSNDTDGAEGVSFGGGSIDITYTLTEGQFLAVSANGETEYEIPRVITQPEPHLINWEFHPGQAREGWILLQIPRVEKKPLLIFKREHVEGIYGIWGYVWFQVCQ